MFMAACLLLAGSSRISAQEILLSGHGLGPGQGLGADAERVLDRDGDGRDDLVCGAPSASAGGFNAVGELALFSSATGERIATISGTAAGGRFGQSVRQTGDLNGDGYPELLVGEPGSTGACVGGRLVLLDGVTLSRLSSLPGPVAMARLGERLVVLDDLNGDGVPELAASAPGYTLGVDAGVGAVLIVDPVSLTTLRTLTGQFPYDAFGTGLGTLPDLNGDGRRELVVGSPGFDPPGLTGAGLVQVINPLNGVTLRAFPGQSASDGLGFTCDGLPDANGDLVPDLIAGAPSAAPGGTPLAGKGVLLSGSDGTVLATHAGAFSSDSFGMAVCGLGDLDQDGFGDYACGSPYARAAGLSAAGRMLVFSGATATLLYAFEGTLAGGGRGGLIRPLSDMNEDGRDDFALGSPAADGAAGANQGRIDLHLGQKGDLTIESTGQYGSPFAIRVQAHPSQLVLLLVDLQQGSLHTKYGEICLALGPAFAWAPLGWTTPDGWLTVSGTLPPSGPPSTPLYTQCLVANPSSPPIYWTGGCASLLLIP